MPNKSQFSLEEQIAIKAAIFRGDPPAKIVEDHPGMSLSAVAQTKRGAQWAKVPWPGDVTGPMPANQAETLKGQRAYDSRVGIYTGHLYEGTIAWYDATAQDAVDGFKRRGKYEEMDAWAVSLGFPSLFEKLKFDLMENDRIKEEAERKKHEEDMAEAVRRQDIHNQKLMIQYPGFDPAIPSTHSFIPKRPRPQDMPINAETMNKVDWEKIERQYSEVPIVVEALASEDPDIKTAIRIMATAMLPDSSQFEMSVRSMMKKIKAWQAQNTPHLVVIK